MTTFRIGMRAPGFYSPDVPMREYAPQTKKCAAGAVDPCSQRLGIGPPLPDPQLYLHSRLAQHIDESINAELVDFTAQQVVQPGLRDPQSLGRPGFGQPTRDLANLGHESGTEQQILRFDVWKSEFGE
jgi:hypothetical protein